jgi:hypothetical protein
MFWYEYLYFGVIGQGENKMSTNPIKHRLSAYFSDGKLHRIAVKKADSDGKYVETKAARGAKDLTIAKKASRAWNLFGRGISDQKEIIQTVNTPPTRPSRGPPAKQALSEPLPSGAISPRRHRRRGRRDRRSTREAD